jgi:hypothetical protein
MGLKGDRDMEGKCWWCGMASIRPLCTLCASSKYAVRNVTKAIKRGSTPTAAMNKTRDVYQVKRGKDIRRYGQESFAVFTIYDRGSLIVQELL